MAARTGTGAVESVGHSAAQTRIVEAAAILFSEHGVGGTSLQMIADALGVTKAAVYHQFPAKEGIVVAVAEAELARLEVLVATAEAEADPVRRRDVLVASIVDLAVERRRMESTLLGDPVIIRYFEHDDAFREVMSRLYRILSGGNPDPDVRLSAAMLTAAIGGAVMHPLVADVDDDTLRSQLLHLARRFLELPD